MTKPFFSIIIPSLNEEAYLPRLLHNLIKQKEKEFEVIIIDGKSSDATIASAQKYRETLPLTIFTSDKSNVSYQRNLGAQKATGEYLIFFDADVQVPPRYLQQLKLQIMKGPVDFLTTYLRADSNIMADKLFATFFNLGMESTLFLERPFIPGFNFIVKRDVFVATVGFDPHIVHGEDFELANRLFKQGFKMVLFKNPRIIFSLRRYRQEGRLAVIRKHAQATLHVFTKGHIKQEIFDYPMGGGWYKLAKKPVNSDTLSKAEKYMKRFMKIFKD